MKRLMFFAAAQMLLVPLWAQDRILSVRVFAESGYGWFYVDGVPYSGSATFLWPEGSSHVLQAFTRAPDSEQSDAERVICAGGTWKDSANNAVGGTTATVIATYGISGYSTQGCAKQFKIRVRFSFDSGGGGGLFSCSDSQGGNVIVDGVCVASDTDLWGAGPIVFQANAPAGWVFAGWIGTGLTAQGTRATALANSPLVVYAKFAPAVHATVVTSPPGLQVLVDRQTITTPASFDWPANSTHAIAPVTPQRDPNQTSWWAFDSWAHGGEAVQNITVGEAVVAVSLTARYSPAVNVNISTRPLGLKLSIDGQAYSWNNVYAYLWAEGSKHKLSAPAQQTDAAGRQYVFRNWSLGDSPDQEIVAGTVTSAIAYYDVLGRMTLHSSPGGVTLTVDGTPCITPCILDRRAGAEVKISAPALVSESDSVRLDFQGWSDGAPRERAWTASNDAQTLTANFLSSYRVSAAVDPAETGTVRLEPASADGFYAEGTELTITAVPASGYRLKYWEGDLTGLAKSETVRVWTPMSVRALMEKGPSDVPAVVANAAGETPEEGVAAGSVIAIYGAELAAGTVTGPLSPLAQTLGGVTVQVSDRVLPLFFVSPEQINAQLPSDLPEGDYTLKIQPDGLPLQTAKFKIVRNAPGLFARPVDQQHFGLMLHKDGNSLVTLSSPAVKGEIVTLLGTGFGPFKGNTVDGFAVPAGLDVPLVDPMELRIGDRVITPDSALAAVGYVGLVAIKFRVPDDMASGSVELRAAVNGKESNKVLLPVE